MSFATICACVLLAVLAVSDGFSYKRVCYYTNWSQYRTGQGKFLPEDIDPFLCTHVIYAFATMNNNKLAPYEWNDESTASSKGMYERVNDLKKKNANLKTLIAVGGWNFGTAKMTVMLKSNRTRYEFAETSIKFLRDRNFDGLDLDFEYPGSRGSPSTDKKKYANLVKALRRSFAAEAKRTGKKRLLLSAAVSAGKTTIDAGYDIPKVARFLDFINLMAYDLHGGWETKTGFNAPLYSRSGEASWEKQLNVAWAAKYWVKKGCPSRKLVVGMATYGRAFKLKNSAVNGVGVGTTGAAPLGPFTRESGFYAYYEICKNFIEGNGANVKWDSEHKVPYAHKGNVWVGYDNEYSLQLKVQWMLKQQLGGWMVWDLDLDDFTGNFCGAGKFPLIKRLKKALKGKTITTTTFKPTTHEPGWTPPSTLPTTTEEDRSPGGSTTMCDSKADGFYPRSDACFRFYRCVNKITYHFTCSNNLIFDPAQDVCEYPENVSAENTAACGLVVQTTTAGPTTTTPAASGSTTTNPFLQAAAVDVPTDTICSGKTDGFYPTKGGDCEIFHRCVTGVFYKYNCPTGLYFDPKYSYCNYQDQLSATDLAYCKA